MKIIVWYGSQRRQLAEEEHELEVNDRETPESIGEIVYDNAPEWLVDTELWELGYRLYGWCYK